jgi:hypothetical protein
MAACRFSRFLLNPSDSRVNRRMNVRTVKVVPLDVRRGYRSLFLFIYPAYAAPLGADHFRKTVSLPNAGVP